MDRRCGDYWVGDWVFEDVVGFLEECSERVWSLQISFVFTSEGTEIVFPG